MYECDMCMRRFNTFRACSQHMNALDHWAPKVPCETCALKFRTEEDANEHMRDSNHYETYCPSCDRHFQSNNNLRMHLKSHVHCGISVNCPFCNKGYTAFSGLSHHLETGSCSQAPSLNRETILRAVRERDTQGIITNRQIEWHDAESVRYEVSALSYNGFNWECYLCHQEFATQTALTQHVNSPRHKQKAYKCPNTRGGCERHFVTLAALFNHWESEQCSFMRFENVQLHARQILDGRRMISF
ncbi:hypothetical protein C2857_000753 [Epichloe festucae Fl1]|uniref:C2H2-type domain-containing protein n=1 Tax=Epichloe festucae (strain Fl1) TaxID=877507 RepID=A0A7S9KN40_EPIFF|nr:hypothetical protein C2857_000753 [Epichloe festucae Fl1]